MPLSTHLSVLQKIHTYLLSWVQSPIYPHLHCLSVAQQDKTHHLQHCMQDLEPTYMAKVWSVTCQTLEMLSYNFFSFVLKDQEEMEGTHGRTVQKRS